MKTPLLRSVAALATTIALCAPASAGIIEGWVTDGAGDIALEGALVRVVETGATTSTDRAGRFRFAAVPAGDYTLSVSYVGTESVSREITLASDDDSARLEVKLGDNIALMENILVIGQRGALNSALSQQRSADGVITVLSADAISQLPDENVAEAARRAAGVNVQNDQGEGRFISIRGADPNLVSTTINGVRIPSPEADARQVPLDVIDSDVLSAIVVTKSLTPDLDGDNIGGNVEIRTLSGLDQDRLFVRLRGAGLYANQVEEFGQRYSGVFANNFLNDSVGVAASVAWQRRNFGSENVEADNPVFDDLGGFFEEFQQRDYAIRRERLSTSLNVDWQATDTTRFFLRGLYSDFSDDEIRTVTVTEFNADAVAASSAPGAITFDAGVEPIEAAREVRSRFEEQLIWSVSGGGEHRFGRLTLDYSGAYSFADEDEPNATDAIFAAEFEDGLADVDLSDRRFPRLSFPDPALADAYFDTDSYEFDEFEITDGLTEDEELAFTLNARYDADLFGAPGYIKTGGKVRLREKSYDVDIQVFDGFDGDLVLSDVATTVEHDLSAINPSVGPGAFASLFDANRDLFELDEATSAIDSRVEDFTAEEDVFAGYVMAQRQFGDISAIAGVRVEHTDYNAVGFSVLEQQFEEAFEGDVTGDVAALLPPPAITGDILFEDVEAEFDGGETAVELIRVIAARQTVEDSYTDWLPSVNARWDVSDEFVARFGYYRSIARPNIEAVAPRVAIEQDGGDIEGEFGNPDLDRQQADNIDVSLEWYPGLRSVLSVSAFYKNIRDFIAPQTFQEITVNGVAFEEAVTFVNLDNARIVGVELNAQAPLDFLPGPLSGLIINGNYTFVDSEATVFDEDGSGRDTALPGQSRHVATGILGYENQLLNLRFAATYRDEFLDVLNEGGDGVDRFVDPFVQYDVTGKYNVTDTVQIFTEFKNINNRPFIATFRQPGFAPLLSQNEEYGWQARFGAQFTY